jgi:hypothetical protein
MHWNILNLNLKSSLLCTNYRNLDTRETLVLLDSFWICGLKLQSRQIYFIVNRDDVGLNGIQEEINKFKASFIS